MRHLQAGRKLGVDAPHRKALLRNLTLAMLERESITTLVPRAKELRSYADRMVTLAKRGDVASRRQIVQILGSTETASHLGNRVRLAVERLYEEILPRFKDRQGGYTQILRLSKRRLGDHAELCVIRYLPPPESAKDGKDKKAKKSAKAEAKETKADKTLSAKAEDKPSKKTPVEDKAPTAKKPKKTDKEKA